ncbi:hypothetical protein CC85DRAFT_300645 [Cutaneotrichosporon oleaginosum]|uniref:Uncharacterized protein n=1 Tax=Cutaneotrichosporon oleaginosum TaxID=879819 RepID=A0A0J0XT09_9TREE|nr:uncharacterized protein CC85DRAFT_300645 [Cutaneotrichosporon oleaginosum]KLT44211.1 hypothetical protein CC85DRAFT_300645 [Cutaneotrichosporon oleaginosum]TXT11620.1 hypothetical protein COLE_02030 [Cutaneotrichosporon oleaginosum]
MRTPVVHADHGSRSDSGIDEDDERLTFPRDDWPRFTYYIPRVLGNRIFDDDILFAAQQASRKVAQSIGAGQLDGLVDELDLNMAVLDVVIQINDEFRDECRASHCRVTNTVEEWRQLLRDVAKVVVETARQTLGHALGASASASAIATLDHWHNAAEAREALIVTCMEQLWSPRDTLEKVSCPAPRSAVLPFIERYGPGELEKAHLWYSCDYDPVTHTLTNYTVTWDGIRSPATPEPMVPCLEAMPDLSSSVESFPSSGFPSPQNSNDNVDDDHSEQSVVVNHKIEDGQIGSALNSSAGSITH